MANAGLIRANRLLFAFACIASSVVQAQEPMALWYRPPVDQATPRRVGGGVRGATPALPWIAVVAPDHLARTRSAQPTLYWYLSDATTTRIEVALIVPGRAEPVLEALVSGSRAGLQAFRPGDFGMRLEPDVQYEWSIAVVSDPAERSRDVFASAALVRVDDPPELRERLTNGGERASVLARAGLWYDAFDALVSEVASRPGEAELRERLIGLLESIGLSDVAARERAR